MSFRFHPDAETELAEAVQYYEGIEPGLGQDFAVEAYSATELAIAYPQAWAILDGEVRRILVRRFPYGIVFAEDNQGIVVIAVMHLHRMPGYWKKRV